MYTRPSASSQIIRLGYWSCYLLDSSNNSVATGTSIHTSMDNSIVYSCPLTTRYLGGDASGPTICLTLSVLITFLGVLGLVSNIVNIMVLRKMSHSRSLNRRLILLAVFDLMVSCFAVFTAVLLHVIIDNINRSKWTLIMFRVSFLLYSLGRTGSVFITILVTIERYFVVTQSFQGRTWLTSRRSNTLTVGFLLGIILINIPWWLNSVLINNTTRQFSKGDELRNYPYVFAMTTFGSQIYFGGIFRPIHVSIDFVLPLPLLLVFNGLLYRFLYNWFKTRELLTAPHQKEIKASRMFFVIVFALLVCHIAGALSVVISETTGVLYRELQLGTIMTNTFNAMNNLIIYYVLSHDFRECFWRLIDSRQRSSDAKRLQESELSELRNAGK